MTWEKCDGVLNLFPLNQKLSVSKQVKSPGVVPVQMGTGKDNYFDVIRGKTNVLLLPGN
jgi:hypothetical protein